MRLVKPKKFLGQHFLKDLKVAQDIADTVDACPKLPILEVGPGMGVLTQFLLPKERTVKVVEVDYEWVAYLREAYQKEVAERIAAGPGSKTYGILSVLIQAWYRVEYLFTVSEHVFNPPPKVKSAVIRMTRNDTRQLGCDEKLFKQVVKTTFNQRRKTLRNSIKPILGKECPLTEDILFNKRPEQLSVQEFIELTNRVGTALKEMKEETDKRAFNGFQP